MGNDISWRKSKLLEIKALNTLKEVAVDRSGENLTRIPPDAIRVLQYSLKGLSLSRNKLEELPASFGGLKQLVELKLDRNKLKHLPSSFHELQQLSILDLSTNELTSLPENFYKLKSLTQLWLTNNMLRTLPDNLGFGVQKLQEIRACHNVLTHLPETFTRLKSLHHMAFEFNHLSEIHSHVGNMQTMNSMLLEHNHILQLPNSICKMPELTVLMVQKNPLERLPDLFGNLTQLKRLSVSHGKHMFELPETFTQLASLRSVRTPTCSHTRKQHHFLPHNNVSTLYFTHVAPSAMSTVTHPNYQLHYLLLPPTTIPKCGLSDNILSSIPNSFVNLQMVVDLDLSFNKLATVPEDGWDLMRALRCLWLNGNRLTHIPLSICKSSIQDLYLHQNQIGELPEEMNEMQGLLSLTLQVNPIKALPSTFAELSNLKRLQVQRTKLETLELEIAQGLTSLEHIVVDKRLLLNMPAEVLQWMNTIKHVQH